MPHPLIGQAGPQITLPSATGDSYTVSPGMNGSPLALFFYPKSGSLGCTKEACEFRDALKDTTNDIFKRTKVEVIGISPDGVDKQKKFVDENGLNYPVLSDEKGEARKVYQVGKGLLGLSEGRVTFFIDEKGVVRDVCDTVLNFAAHVKFVNKWLAIVEKEASAPTKTTTAEAPAPATATPSNAT